LNKIFVFASKLLDIGRFGPTHRSMRCPEPQDEGLVARGGS